MARSSGPLASAACSVTIAGCRKPRDVTFEPNTPDCHPTAVIALLSASAQVSPHNFAVSFGDGLISESDLMATVAEICGP
jgi:hypothetical protein